MTAMLPENDNESNPTELFGFAGPPLAVSNESFTSLLLGTIYKYPPVSVAILVTLKDFKSRDKVACVTAKPR